MTGRVHHRNGAAYPAETICVRMTPVQLADAVLAAATAALSDRHLDPSLLPEATILERPKNPDHGDYASTLALQMARKTGVPAHELAQAIADKLISDAAIQSARVAGGGFLNIRLQSSATGAVAGTVIEQGGAYGQGTKLAGQRVNLEFVSANPTGPIHIGGSRWAAVGDALARLLRAEGAAVTTEYYFNDAGAQIDRFAASLLAAARHDAAPDDGYVGEYIAEIAERVLKDHPGALAKPAADAQEIFRSEGVALMFDEIKASLANFGVHFDVHFAEKDLHDKGELGAALARLRQLGHVYDADGATWIRTTEFGDDKDRVYVRGNGDFTYYAADCAYYLDKRARGFDKVMIVLGADHHGYVGRLRALAACFGDNPDQTLEILIGQLVNLVRDGRPLRMSKRAGTIVTIDEAESTQPGTHSPGTRWTRQSISTWTYGRGEAATTPSITSSMRTPGSPLCCGTPPSRGIPWAASTTRACSPTTVRTTSSRPSLTSRASSPAPRNYVSRTGSRDTWKTSQARITGSTTPAASCPTTAAQWMTSAGPGCGWLRQRG